MAPEATLEGLDVSEGAAEAAKPVRLAGGLLLAQVLLAGVAGYCRYYAGKIMPGSGYFVLLALDVLLGAGLLLGLKHLPRVALVRAALLGPGIALWLLFPRHAQAGQLQLALGGVLLLLLVGRPGVLRHAAATALSVLLLGFGLADAAGAWQEREARTRGWEEGRREQLRRLHDEAARRGW